MTPQVSIVVATYQRRRLVRRLVEAALAQEGVDHEVVVVDNGSTDGTADELARLVAADTTGRLRVERIEVNHGPGRARNLGWRSARAPLVAFTDDDCVPTAGWAAALVAAAEDADVVQGRTLPLPDAPARSYWARSQSIEGWTDRYETCNLLVRTADVAAVGGFDERFAVAMGEDTDLGLRLVDHGVRTTYAPAALVHHEVWDRSWMDHLRERSRWAAIVELVALQPRVRETLRHRWYWRRSHLAVLAAVPVTAGCVAAGWWEVVPTAVGGYAVAYAIRTSHRDRGLPERIVRGVQDLVSTAWETACFTSASVRHRTLLL